METLVIGAGVVGLAVARALAVRGHDVVVAEAADGIGTGVSSRNSEVIHAGLYYPTDSLRARHSVRGRELLYRYCETHHVPHRRCGKLVVATVPGEMPAIERIAAQGRTNGVEGLRLLGSTEARGLEPAVACHAALLSPDTGIVDSHALMLALRGDIERHGGMLAFRTPVEGLEPVAGGGWVARFGGVEPGTLCVDAVVNAASLAAQSIAVRTDRYPAERIPKLVLAKGNYFGCRRPSPFSHLIYPAPVEGGLGIHVTMDLAGRLRFGPDVEWVDTADYTVDANRRHAFGAAIRRYWPDLSDEDLVPDYAGLRPKLTGPGEPAADFLLDGPAEHGLAGLMHLFGIESPGLTASLSLAEEVADRLDA